MPELVERLSQISPSRKAIYGLMNRHRNLRYAF